VANDPVVLKSVIFWKIKVRFEYLWGALSGSNGFLYLLRVKISVSQVFVQIGPLEVCEGPSFLPPRGGGSRAPPGGPGPDLLDFDII
jgi:hypothetical protein